MTTVKIIKGQRVYWKPEFKDHGDDNYIFMAAEDQHGDYIRVGIFNPSASKNSMLQLTFQTVQVHTIERVEDYANIVHQLGPRL